MTTYLIKSPNIGWSTAEAGYALFIKSGIRQMHRGYEGWSVMEIENTEVANRLIPILTGLNMGGPEKME